MFQLTIPQATDYPFAFFYMDLRQPDDQLKTGMFGIFSAPLSGQIFPATSGLTGHQTKHDFFHRGRGLLPDSRIIQGQYSLSTDGYPSAKVGGTMFHITPDPVHPDLDWLRSVEVLSNWKSGLDKPTADSIRSELGLHWDNPHPRGTSGCNGIIHSGHFDAICDILLDIKRQGKLTIPYFVHYDW